MTQVLIRPWRSGDTVSITEIYAQAVRADTSTFELDAPSVVAMARRIATITDAGYPFLVAEHDGAVQGYAYASTFRARAAFDLTLEDSVYVAPSAQRRGIGRALLAGLIIAARAKGFRQMIAVIGDSRTTAASVALHSVLGFVTKGRLEAVGRKHGRWLDVELMQLDLQRLT